VLFFTIYVPVNPAHWTSIAGRGREGCNPSCQRVRLYRDLMESVEDIFVYNPSCQRKGWNMFYY
jgi:hypothetical protein